VGHVGLADPAGQYEPEAQLLHEASLACPSRPLYLPAAQAVFVEKVGQ